MDDRAGNSMKVAAVASLWLIIALISGASGNLASLNPPLPQMILFALVIILLLAFWLLRDFRAWCLGVDVKVFLLFNLVRFVGVYFLILHAEGRLPYDFAVIGGWGDIIIAALAVGLILFIPARGKAPWFLYFLWNLLGLLDILFVVVTAGRLAMADPGSMSELLKLPLSLLPTFIVPIIIFFHIILFVRLYKSWKSGYDSI